MPNKLLCSYIFVKYGWRRLKKIQKTHVYELYKQLHLFKVTTTEKVADFVTSLML